MKKAQGLSVNMLVLIALGLAVLIISIIIFANRSKDADKKLDGATGCEFLGGRCDIDCGVDGRAAGFCPKSTSGQDQICCNKRVTTPQGTG